MCLPNLVVEWLTLRLRITEVPGLNLGQKAGNPDWVFFRGFPQSHQEYAWIVP
jgi:hypothetical protein